MDTNKMREEFIRAYRRLLIAEGMNVQESRFELRDGEFVHRETAIAWWAWQASREAVVVELPATGTLLVPGWNQAVHRCCEAIEAHGLKVRP
ncbi:MULTISPECIES: hypothetical protein [Pseudomonas]|uniref:hypothetical protein n=1 Tax=Pseudomonas TaxID=286 RepID=UPI0002A15B20|nr:MULTISPECIES: hypothetical protein [Pseudomonas]AGA72632.1 hypothetical protein B479_08600 [Pseudomonas putida HB3267]MCE0757202.1 hypothetical protein [Pseudomonas asiatica]MCE0946450.1 hypothetical protein [Pseudomonas asiatica]MCE0956013.1 hypothetical protein [Pseudomonas asiatica]MCE1031058.1 hypothetical protein [Pseudomonas asiatica]